MAFYRTSELFPHGSELDIQSKIKILTAVSLQSVVEKCETERQKLLNEFPELNTWHWKNPEASGQNPNVDEALE